MKRNFCKRLLALMMVFCMFAPQSALAAGTYYLEVSIEEQDDPQNIVTSESAGYLVESEKLVPLVVSAINERYEDGSLAKQFPSPAMREILLEGIKAYKKINRDNGAAWDKYQNKYYSDVDDTLGLKKLMTDFDSTIGQLEVDKEYQMTFKNEVKKDREYGETYVVTVVRRNYGGSSTSENPFTDVKSSDWFYNPVLWAVENGVTAGTSATTFSPSAACTRAQAVTFLWNANGSPAPKSTENPFTDVKPTDWFYAPVLWAVENGVTAGTSATTFSPNNQCTRAHIVTFLRNAEGAPAATGTNPFTDVVSTDWFYAPVLWAVENGVTAGTSATTFSPNATCTRAQIVTFLYNYMGK